MSIELCAGHYGQIGRCWSQVAASLLATFFLTATTTSGFSQSMALPGSFSVGASGAATYNVPIAMPPGTAGMAPSLSLEYSSDGGNGMLGVGWSLGGLPAIGRCPRTAAQDGVIGGINYDGNDRFCLEGQRLVAISGTYGADGTEYRTEIDGYSRILSHGTAGNGPAWFEMHTKAGQVMQFGNTADSQILAQGKTTARSWALNKVSDSKGNYFTVTWVNDSANGQLYPAWIYYTGNTAASLATFNSVQFVYATRPDVISGYQGGSLIQTTARLTDVKTYAGSALVADYRLGYEQGAATQRSRLTSVTLCAGDNSCLAPVSFAWQEGTIAWSPGFSSQTGTDWISWPSAKMITGDFNGDGFTDIAVTAPSMGGIGVYLSNGDGTFHAVFSSQTGTDWSSWPNAIMIGGDFNADGRSDLAVIMPNGVNGGAPGGGIGTYLSNGDGTFHAVWSSQTGTDWASWPNARPVGGDFNGDGRSDIAVTFPNGVNGAPSPGGIGTYLSNGDGTFRAVFSGQTGTDWSSWPNEIPISGDFNGDGLTDIAVTFLNGINRAPSPGGIATYLSNGDGTFRAMFSGQTGTDWSSWPNAIPTGGDFNGDGLSDIAITLPNGVNGGAPGGGIATYLSNGDGTFHAVWGSQTGTDWSSWPNEIPIGGDFNGDGRSDIAVILPNGVNGGAPGGGIATYFSNGDGTFRAVWSDQTGTDWSSWPSARPASGSFSPSGLTDLAIGANSLGGVATYTAGGNAGVLPDHILSIGNGLGATTSITYKSLTNTSIYTKDAGTAYPQQDLQAGMRVVSRVDTSNGIGGTYSSTYNYAGAKLDLSGRGFLGFRQMAVTDLQTGIVQTTTYRQDFPYIGLLGTTTKILGTLTLNQTTNSYQFSNAGGTTSIAPASAPYKVSVSQSVAQSSDLDGSAMPTATTSFQYDAYGNATSVVASTPDGFSKTTANTYNNDTTNWYLGRLTRATVTSQAP